MPSGKIEGDHDGCRKGNYHCKKCIGKEFFHAHFENILQRFAPSCPFWQILLR